MHHAWGDNARIDGYEATWTTSVTPQTTTGIIRSVFPRGATGTALLNPARTTAQFADLINTLNADNTAQLSVRQVAAVGTSASTIQGRNNTLGNFLTGAGVNPSQIVPFMLLPPAGIAIGDVVTQLTTLNITRVFNP